jgi:PAS domain S-box-containing protein
MEGERVLEHIVAQLKDMLCIIRLDGTIYQINPAGLGMLGQNPDDVLNQPWDKMFEEHTRPLSGEIIAQTIEGGIWGGEMLFQRADGEIFPVYLSTSLIPDPSEKENYIAAFASDITHKKRLEEVARKRIELANKIILNAPLGIFALDEEGLIQIVNNECLRMLGLKSKSEVIQKRTDELPVSLNPTLEAQITKALSGEAVSELNYLLRGDEQEQLTVSLNLIPLEGPKGVVDGVLGLFEDRTDKVKMEEKLLQADKLASMGYLAAGVAHEISNPLAGMYTIIEGFRDRARRNNEDDEAFERILSSIDRIKGIIQKLLAFARPSAQAAQMTQLNDLIIFSVDFFKHQPVYRRIRINCDLSEDLPATYLDRNQITQVLHNLFINAAQAMPDGGELTIRTKPVNGKIKLEFEDTGTGISSGNLQRIFDPFFTTKPAGTGTGLGLSVSYSIIQEHGGTIEVDSHVDIGTMFTIILPVKIVTKVFAEE